MKTLEETGTNRAAVRFVLTASGWSVLLFGLLRAPWIVSHVLEPLVALQKVLVAAVGCRGPAPVFISLECSGAEVIALCTGMLLAFPVAWPRRGLGVAGAVVWLIALNTGRIAVLWHTAASPALFRSLHLYILPALLLLAAAGYTAVFMRWSLAKREHAAAGAESRPRGSLQTFAVTAAGLLILYAAATPWLMESPLVRHAAEVTAAVAAVIARGLGVSATASGQLFSCAGRLYAVTPECVLSPVLPLLVAGALGLPLSRGRRLLLVATAFVLSGLLGVSRLLVLAVPSWIVENPMFLAHGFRQLVVGAGAIALAAALRDSGVGRGWRTVRRAFTAAAVGVAAAVAAAPLLTLWRHAVTGGAPLVPPGDMQGAVALLPAYQIGLFAALWTAWGGLGASGVWALGALMLAQTVTLGLLAAGATRAHVFAPALLVRAWAVALPLGLAWWSARRQRRVADDGGYHGFWRNVGEQFPDLGGAASTNLYRDDEKRLLSQHLPPLAGARLFKTDLWDEARNTRILQWAEGEGARVFGIDISRPTLERARGEFKGHPLGAAVSDVRRLPFRDGVFDAVYSMGTIEHFQEVETAVAEIFRVTAPGGRAIVGVPNLWDPFLRPLLVRMLSAFGLYDYGYERAFSRRALRRMLEQAGFEVVAETAILFIPGWLRMADLWCHTRYRPLARVTAVGVGFFAWLGRRVPALQRHGYLLATVVRRPTRH